MRAIRSMPRCTPKYTMDRHHDQRGERELEDAVRDLGVEEVAHGEIHGEPAHGPPHGAREEVEERPARDDRVVREENEPAEHAPATDDGPERTDRGLEGADGALLCLPADEQLGHHDGKADRQDAEEVDEDEGAPVVLPGDEGSNVRADLPCLHSLPIRFRIMAREHGDARGLPTPGQLLDYSRTRGRSGRAAHSHPTPS